MGAHRSRPPSLIDWELSFPDTAADTDTDPDGFQLLTPGDPVVFALGGTPVVGVSVEHLTLTIGDNVHISGAFSFRLGETETVDVNTGSVADRAACRFPVVAVSGRTRARPWAAGDYSMIWNLQVTTIKIGAEGVSVFLGDISPTTTWTTTSPTATARSTWTSSATTLRASSSRTSPSASCLPASSPESARSAPEPAQVPRPEADRGLGGPRRLRGLLTLTSRGIVIEVNPGTNLALASPAARSTGRSASPAARPGFPFRRVIR